MNVVVMRKMPVERGIRANKLILEKSPYLLQHSHNPVDWYSWGEEAFQKAQAEDKPVFLSIGYSTCHWCHMMEKESLEDSEVAKMLNDTFVCIKVDREERPARAIFARFVEIKLRSSKREKEHLSAAANQ